MSDLIRDRLQAVASQSKDDIQRRIDQTQKCITTFDAVQARSALIARRMVDKGDAAAFKQLVDDFNTLQDLSKDAAAEFTALAGLPQVQVDSTKAITK